MTVLVVVLAAALTSPGAAADAGRCDSTAGPMELVSPKVGRFAKDTARRLGTPISICAVPMLPIDTWVAMDLPSDDPRRLLALDTWNRELMSSAGIAPRPGDSTFPTAVFVNISRTPQRFISEVAAHEIAHLALEVGGMRHPLQHKTDSSQSQRLKRIANFVADVAADRLLARESIDAVAYLRHVLMETTEPLLSSGVSRRTGGPVGGETLLLTTMLARAYLTLKVDRVSIDYLQTRLPPHAVNMARHFRTVLSTAPLDDAEDYERIVRRLAAAVGIKEVDFGPRAGSPNEDRSTGGEGVRNSSKVHDLLL